MGLMGWFWIAMSVIALLAGGRYLLRLRGTRERADAPALDDAALRQIMETGRLRTPPRGTVDMRRAAEAEEEFWAEEWEEPEEFGR